MSRTNRIEGVDSHVAVEKCSQCDNRPCVLCPTCPRRTQPGFEKSRDDQGFRKLHEREPQEARLKLATAKAAKALANCPPHHPAYPGICEAYEQARDAEMAYLSRSTPA